MKQIIKNKEKAKADEKINDIFSHAFVDPLLNSFIFCQIR